MGLLFREMDLVQPLFNKTYPSTVSPVAFINQ